MGSGALPQEDLSVYAAQSLLRGTIPARLAYTSTDGTPRVVPIWFHWTAEEFVIGTPAAAPKLKALKRDPRVALTIDQDDFPAQVLLVRGTPRPQGDGRGGSGIRAGSPPISWRGTGARVGGAGREDVSEDGPDLSQAEWVGVLDFQQRFLSGIESAMP